MKKAVVLLSSGLDSTVNLYAAVKEYHVVRVLTFDYGQRAATQEIAKSRALCQKLNLDHQVLELPWFKNLSTSALINHQFAVPTQEQVSIDSYEQSVQTAKSVWVPNRNGVFLNIAAAIAEGLGADYIVPGFNREEASTFPDNSKEFMQALDLSFSFSTASRVEVKCFTIDMDKTAIARLGRELDVPFSMIWPCYFAGDEICLKCESCLRYQRAMSGLKSE